MDKTLNIKFWVKEIRFPMDKAHRVRNNMNKDKVLSIKKPIIFKGIIKKYPLGFNSSGYL